MIFTDNFMEYTQGLFIWQTTFARENEKFLWEYQRVTDPKVFAQREGVFS